MASGDLAHGLELLLGGLKGGFQAGVLGISPRQPGRPAVEIAIYSDVVWLAARSLRAHSASQPAAL